MCVCVCVCVCVCAGDKYIVLLFDNIYSMITGRNKT